MNPEQRKSSIATLTATFIAIGVATAIAILYVHHVQRSRVAAAQQQIAALVACPLPSEHEQVHVVITQQGGRFVAQCMHVAARGLYRRAPQRNSYRM